ncbi:MAG: CAP domain-containing protein [Candidatus Spechtbacteria bacterium SB0662_bin_43]|uniref:CAP domain-containing protein n=1 Tax=Candidatus Spechtbacteria bacterium SB0662_bin_43 TaxID=2604897 RepID=A0A845DDU3_9BACT|nr:CAP domain-containing protein [Candidatus Spechtbacteria bacterium SB0662_bin_43]
MYDTPKIIDKKVLIALCFVLVVGAGVAISTFVFSEDTNVSTRVPAGAVPSENVVGSDSQEQEAKQQQGEDTNDNGNNTDPPESTEDGDTNTVVDSVRPTTTVQNNNNPSPIPGDSSSGFDAAKVISATNAYRAQRGLAPLRYNEALALSANRKVDLIFQEQHFEHRSLSGKEVSDLIQEAGYQFLAVGENLALGTYRSEQEIVELWIQSPAHHAILVSPYFEDIAIGIKQGVFEGQRVWVAVQHFGRPAAACAPVAPQQALKQRIDSQSEQLRVWEQEIQEKQAVLKKYAPSYGVEYNQVAREYDSLVQQYNALLQEAKQAINTYNKQAKAYNDCISMGV